MSFWIKKYNIELAHLPFSLLSRSIFVVFLCLGLLSSILLLLPIQDKIKGKVVIYAQGQPLSLNAPSSGFLHLHQFENDKISRGDLLATIDVNINQKDLQELSELINQDLLFLDFNKTSEIFTRIKKLVNHDFKEINNELFILINKLQQLEVLKSVSDPKDLMISLDHSIKLKSKQLLSFESLNQSTRKVLALIREQLEADSSLLELGGISERELSERRKVYIDQQSLLIENDLRRQSLAGEIINDEKEKKQLAKDHSSKLEELRIGIFDQIRAIRNAYQNFVKDYCIISPRDGYVSLPYDIVDQEMINEGTGILFLTPSNQNQSAKSEMFVGAQNAGSIKPGMKVRLGLSEFDQKEYGIYYTTIQSISEVPQNGKYKLILKCSLPLTTSYNITIPTRETYNGDGEVLLGKINLLTKISREIQFNKTKYASL